MRCKLGGIDRPIAIAIQGRESGRLTGISHLVTLLCPRAEPIGAGLIKFLFDEASIAIQVVLSEGRPVAAHAAAHSHPLRLDGYSKSDTDRERHA